MGNYFNPGNEGFRRMVNSEIYVDKTGMPDGMSDRSRIPQSLCGGK